VNAVPSRYCLCELQTFHSFDVSPPGQFAPCVNASPVKTVGRRNDGKEDDEDIDIVRPSAYKMSFHSSSFLLYYTLRPTAPSAIFSERNVQARIDETSRGRNVKEAKKSRYRL